MQSILSMSFDVPIRVFWFDISADRMPLLPSG